MTLIERLGMILIIPIILYTMFIYIPVSVYAEAECLRKGYPEYRVSVGLERYCMNLDGSITVTVDKQGD